MNMKALETREVVSSRDCVKETRQIINPDDNTLSVSSTVTESKSYTCNCITLEKKSDSVLKSPEMKIMEISK